MSLEDQLNRLNGNLEAFIPLYERLLASLAYCPSQASVGTTAETAAAPAPVKPKAGSRAATKPAAAEKPAPEPEQSAEPVAEEEPEPNLDEPEPEVAVDHATIRDFYRDASGAAKEAGDTAKIAVIKKSFNDLLKAAKALDDDGVPALSRLPVDQCAKFLADFKAAVG